MVQELENICGWDQEVCRKTKNGLKTIWNDQRNENLKRKITQNSTLITSVVLAALQKPLVEKERSQKVLQYESFFVVTIGRS